MRLRKYTLVAIHEFVVPEGELLVDEAAIGKAFTETCKARMRHTYGYIVGPVEVSVSWVDAKEEL